MRQLRAACTTHENPEIVRLPFGVEQANTYLLIKNGHTILVDVCSRDVVNQLNVRGLTPDYVILTHEHVDHLWGLNALREKYPDIKVIAQKQCSKAICDPKTNKAMQYRIYAVLRFGQDYKNAEAENRSYCCKPADIQFEDIYELNWMGCDIRLVHTPGHSPGSCMIFVENALVFSGDTMLNEQTFLKFDGGDETIFSTMTLPVIHRIQADASIFPGHGAPFLKRDWKRF